MALSARRKHFMAMPALLPGVCAISTAQEIWEPMHPIRLVLGYTPDGAADAVARDLALVRLTLNRVSVCEVALLAVFVAPPSFKGRCEEAFKTE